MNGDVDCFFWLGEPRGICFFMIFSFFLFANEGLKLEICSWNRCFFVGSFRWKFSAPRGVTASDDLLVKTACGGASFEGVNIDTKSCPDLQVAKKGLCVYIYDMY